MRKYQAAWNQLRDKADEPLVISAHPAYHARIYKAIKKEKNLDTIYHLTLSEQGRSSKLARTSNGNELRITLTIEATLYGLF